MSTSYLSGILSTSWSIGWKIELMTQEFSHRLENLFVNIIALVLITQLGILGIGETCVQRTKFTNLIRQLPLCLLLLLLILYNCMAGRTQIHLFFPQYFDQVFLSKCHLIRLNFPGTYSLCIYVLLSVCIKSTCSISHQVQFFFFG